MPPKYRDSFPPLETLIAEMLSEKKFDRHFSEKDLNSFFPSLLLLFPYYIALREIEQERLQLFTEINSMSLRNENDIQTKIDAYKKRSIPVFKKLEEYEAIFHQQQQTLNNFPETLFPNSEQDHLVINTKLRGNRYHYPLVGQYCTRSDLTKDHAGDPYEEEKNAIIPLIPNTTSQQLFTEFKNLHLNLINTAHSILNGQIDATKIPAMDIVNVVKRHAKASERLKQLYANHQNYLTEKRKRSDQICLDKNNPQHLAFWASNTDTGCWGWGGTPIICKGREYRIPRRIYQLMMVVAADHPDVDTFEKEFNAARTQRPWFSNPFSSFFRHGITDRVYSETNANIKTMEVNNRAMP